MKRLGASALPVLVALAVLLSACGGEGESADAGPAQTDTTNDEPLDGLSSQQVEAQARPMTPEEAARMGIPVDTSAHVENLGSPDSVVVPFGRAADSARVDSARTQTPDTTKRQ